MTEANSGRHEVEYCGEYDDEEGVIAEDDVSKPMYIESMID